MTTQPITIFKDKDEAENVAAQIREDDKDGIYTVEEKFGGYVISLCDSGGFFIFYL